MAPAAYITVTVQSGDTLLGLAVANDVPMAAIQLQNDMGSSTIVQLGQSLVIPPKSAWEGASPFWTVHEVVEGETLSEIAQAYGLTVADLQGANGLADADLLGVGQALVLPLTDFATPVAGAAGGCAYRVPPLLRWPRRLTPHRLRLLRCGSGGRAYGDGGTPDCGGATTGRCGRLAA